MDVKSIALVYDDRDPKNKGWYANAFNAEEAKDARQDLEIQISRPTRANAWKGAKAAALRGLRDNGHVIKRGCIVRVYDSIGRDLPSRVVTV